MFMYSGEEKRSYLADIERDGSVCEQAMADDGTSQLRSVLRSIKEHAQ